MAHDQRRHLLLPTPRYEPRGRSTLHRRRHDTLAHQLNKFRKHGLTEYDGERKVHCSLLNVIIRE